MKITFIVYGESRPASFSFGRGKSKEGKPFMWKSAKHADWMKAVALQALEHKPEELMRGAVALALVFWRRKPSSAGKDWQKAKSPERAAKAAYPISKPDLTSLERPIEDVLSGLFYRDDSQILLKHSMKCYAGEDEPERVGICVWGFHPKDALELSQDVYTPMSRSIRDADAGPLPASEPKPQEDPWDAAAKATP